MSEQKGKAQQAAVANRQGGAAPAQQQKPAYSAGPNAAGVKLTHNQEIGLMTGYEILTAETELEEFDISDCYDKAARLIIILGKRNTGKTVIALNWCYNNRDVYPGGLVVTSTAFNRFWQQYFPDYLVVPTFNPALIDAFFQAQKDRVTRRGLNSRLLIIFDDMAHDTALKYSDELSKIAYNGRHYNIDVIFITQDVVRATTSMRRNADLFFVLTMTGFSSVEHIYKEYASIDIADIKHFQALLMKTTEDYGCLVINNTDPNARGKDRFFKYRAKHPDELPKFIMFAPWAWQSADVSERAEKRKKQEKELGQVCKYERSTMAAWKNKRETRVNKEQVAGQTERIRHARPPASQSVMTMLSQMGGTLNHGKEL